MKKNFLIGFVAVACLTSCRTDKFVTTHVSYQSVRSTKHVQEIPDDATIAVGYSITPSGNLYVVINNKTSDILTISQENSFFLDSDGTSYSYFDPSVRGTSTTDFASSTNSAAVNLGAIGGALGIGGPLGGLLSGITLGNAGTSGSATTNSIYTKDLPQISIGPRGKVILSKKYKITGIGDLSSMPVSEIDLTKSSSYCRFSVCISYSADGGVTFKKLVTEFYANSRIVNPIQKYGRVNDALRGIYQTKPDALKEEWYLLSFHSLLGGNYWRGGFVDYQ